MSWQSRLITEGAAIVAALGAVCLALWGREGWGWFLFAAVCMCSATKVREDKP